jgi:hypothetical protein
MLSGEKGWGALAIAIYLTAGGALLGFVGHTYLGALHGRSLGQRLLGLRVVGAPGSVTRGRLVLRLAAFYAMPILLFVGAYALGSAAHQRIDDWGSTHPDWQASYDEASSAEDEANDRVLHSKIGSPEYDRAYSEQVRQNNRLGEIVKQRDATRTAWVADNGDVVGSWLLLLWAAVNGALLFTQGGPVHDRLLRTRVERG